MMGNRRPSRNQRRLADLCRIEHRPLKLGEVMDIERLSRAVYNADWKRQRYASDPVYREQQRARTAAYRARRRAESGA